MIQRKQTLFLLIAAALMVTAFFMPLARFFGEGHEITLTSMEVLDTTHPDMAQPLFKTVCLAILIGLSALLPLLTIFLYKKRFLQLRLCFTEIVLLLGAQGFIVYHVYHLYKSMETVTWKFGISSIFPLLAIFFVALAMRGIVKDQQLIKSLDRIR